VAQQRAIGMELGALMGPTEVTWVLADIALQGRQKERWECAWSAGSRAARAVHAGAGSVGLPLHLALANAISESEWTPKMAL